MEHMRDLFGQADLPITEGIKYAGSKLKLLPYIMRVIESLPDVHTVLDGFSGTTRVSQMFAQLGYDTTSNDISVWSETFGTCYLLKKKRESYYQDIIDHLNSLKGYEGWFSETYGGTESDQKKPFQLHNTKKLDAIRDEIEVLNLNKTDKAVILTSLILALDKVDSTLGHYSSYLAKWSDRSYNTLKLELPHFFPIHTHNVVSHANIFDIIDTPFDFAYFDPPYGSNNEKMPPSRVRYNSYYHIWTTVILNDKPETFGKAGRREDSRDTKSASIFEEFRKDENGHFIAMQAIKQMIEKTNARYILLSYSSGGRATKQELIDIMEENGTLKSLYEINYKKNVMAGMKWTNEWANDSENKEYLILLEKK